MGIDYIDYEQALKIYKKTVDKSGGGMAGIRDAGGIQLMLENVQNDWYYPEIADKAAYMMFSTSLFSSNSLSKSTERFPINFWYSSGITART